MGWLSRPNSRMSRSVTSSGATLRGMRNRCGLPSTRTLAWPYASITPCSASVRDAMTRSRTGFALVAMDLRRGDDAGPARELVLEELAEALRLVDDRREALLRHRLPHVHALQRRVDFRIEARDDRGRRAGGGEDSIPRVDDEVGMARLADRRHLGKGVRALGREHREHAQLSRAHERRHRLQRRDARLHVAA